jgi:protein involved in polysaccharide export with SLBB domain
LTCADLPPGVPCPTDARDATGIFSSAPDKIVAIENDRSNDDRRSDDLGEYGAQRPAVLPPDPTTEFQEFVSDSVGYRLPMFGTTLFRTVPTTFAPVDRVPIPANYVIGPGDELLIRGWGQVEINVRTKVSRAGEIYLPKVGSLNVAGLSFQQLQPYLKSAIGRVFRNFDLNVTLGQLRSIQIFVVGHARRPGAYTVSSLTTLVNAIFSSGGPTVKGSMRRVLLKRGNDVASEFDLYDLLLKGDKSKDVQLLPGDVIYYPPVGDLVAISGSINMPAIYELRGNTCLQDLVEMAGGLTNTAAGQKVTVERIVDRSSREVQEFTLDDGGLGRVMADGDIVRVFAILPRFANAVTVRGNVAQPGRYPWRKGMRIRDLLGNRAALLTREYWRKQNLVAQQAGLRNDLGIPGNSTNLGTNAQPENGSGTNPTTTSAAGISQPPKEVLDPLQLRNDVRLSAPEINWDYAVIQRLNPQDLTTSVITFNLGGAMDGRDGDNVELEPGDVITVFSQADMKVPVEKQTKFVRLEGEFNSAGVYRAEPGETLRQIVARAGGFTDRAYLYGSQFTRESTRQEQQETLDQMIQNLEKEVERNAAQAKNTNSPEQIALLGPKIEGQRRLVEKLRSVKATGRIVLEIRPDAKASDLPDIVLEDGDRFFLPFQPNTIEVIGSVYNQNSFIYRPGKRVSDYLKQAGGATRDADSGRLFVLRADGSIVSKHIQSGLWKGGFGDTRLLPGDSIVVPERLDKTNWLRELKDWSQVVSQFALGAAAIRVIGRP